MHRGQLCIDQIPRHLTSSPSRGWDLIIRVSRGIWSLCIGMESLNQSLVFMWPSNHAHHGRLLWNDFRGKGTPENFWWGCAPWFSISDQKMSFSPAQTVFRRDLKNPYPFSDLAFRQKLCHNYLDQSVNKEFLEMHFEFAYFYFFPRDHEWAPSLLFFLIQLESL